MFADGLDDVPLLANNRTNKRTGNLEMHGHHTFFLGFRLVVHIDRKDRGGMEMEGEREGERRRKRERERKRAVKKKAKRDNRRRQE